MAKSKVKVVTDRRMFMVMVFWLSQKPGRTQTAFCEKIGINPSAIPTIRSGLKSFQINHISRAMKLIGGGNFNFVFGVQNHMFIREAILTPMEMLDQANAAMKDEHKNKR